MKTPRIVGVEAMERISAVEGIAPLTKEDVTFLANLNRLHISREDRTQRIVEYIKALNLGRACL